jgi:hypothetical protein
MTVKHLRNWQKLFEAEILTHQHRINLGGSYRKEFGSRKFQTNQAKNDIHPVSVDLTHANKLEEDAPLIWQPRCVDLLDGVNQQNTADYLKT